MSVSTQLTRYMIVGLTAFATEFASFLLLHAGLNLRLGAAHVISFGAGLLVSFTLQRGWSFEAEQFKFSQPLQFMAHASLATFNLLFTGYMLTRLVTHGFNPALAKPAVMAVTAAWNFMLMRKLIFRSHPPAQRLKERT